MKWIILLILICFLSSQVWAAITPPTFNAATLSVGTTTSFATKDVNHTVPVGTDLLVVMLQGYYSGGGSGSDYQITSITWNDVNLTRIVLPSSWGYDEQAFWYKASPTAGTNGTIKIRGGDSSLGDGGIIHIMDISDVNLSVGTSGIRNVTNNESDTRTTITLSPTTALGDIIISQWSQQGSTTLTGQTYGGTSGAQSLKNSTGYNSDAAFLTTSIPTASGQTVTWLERTGAAYPSGQSVSIAGKEAGGASTCTYSGSGNWLINLADNCNLTTDTNILGNKFYTYGTGSLTLNAWISGCPEAHLIGSNIHWMGKGFK